MFVGRFAPSPSGRMHLGNVYTALLAWLDARKAGGRLILRIEDLDRKRCSMAKAEQLAADLQWLGLDWDEGGLMPEYCQSRRTAHYQAAFDKLAAAGLVYPCFCSRAERLAAVVSAPHLGEKMLAQPCPCRNMSADERAARLRAGKRPPAWRVRVPAEDVRFRDVNMGEYGENLAADCGDFIIKRADGVFAYQLAVVVDDAEMGVNRVVRGRDLLSSTPRQIWLHKMLGHQPPLFCHVPLLMSAAGRRLAKRDSSLDMAALRERYTAPQLIGGLAWLAGLQPEPKPLRPQDLLAGFAWDKVGKEDILLNDLL